MDLRVVSTTTLTSLKTYTVKSSWWWLEVFGMNLSLWVLVNFLIIFFRDIVDLFMGWGMGCLFASGAVGCGVVTFGMTTFSFAVVWFIIFRVMFNWICMCLWDRSFLENMVFYLMYYCVILFKLTLFAVSYLCRAACYLWKKCCFRSVMNVFGLSIDFYFSIVCIGFSIWLEGLIWSIVKVFLSLGVT